MNLRNRSLLVFGLTFFIFFIIIAAVSLGVTLSGLDRIEYQGMGNAVNQTKSALNAESAALLSTTQDWAWWDDMADFAVSHNTEFVERNANTENMVTVKVHLFIVLDENGKMLYSRLLSPDFETNTTVPESLINLLQSNPGMVLHAVDDLGASGILAPPEGMMFVASAPILRSDKSGPARGTIIMGRYLESGPLQRITGMTGYSVVLEPAGRGGPGEARQPLQELLAGRSNLVLAEDNESMISGYSTVRDLTGRDLVIRVSMERELRRTGFANIVTHIALLGLWAVMLGIIVLIVMDRTVLQRIDKLTERVRSLSENPGEVSRPVLSGNDELAELEKTIITSRKDLLMREKQLRVFINAIQGPAALFSREGKILLANPAFADQLNSSPEEVTGSFFRSRLPNNDIARYDRFVQEAIRKKEVIHFEVETNGKTLFMSFYPVLGSDGEVIQLGLLSFDISERKRLENALQKVTKKISLLNTVIFTDIQNKVFVQMGYLDLARQMAPDPRQKSYLEKQEAVVREIQSSLSFARQFNDMGMNPPRWQNVQDVILFAVSHLELGGLSRDFSLEGIEIYADSLLERVFITLIENTIHHAKGSTAIHAGHTISGDDAVIYFEDDGPGIAADKKEEIFKKGMGAGGSTSLFLSREILSITGITLRETGVEGKGARFEIRVPKGSYRIPGK